MCQGEFLHKDEDQGWDLFEDLAKKIIQWESCSDKSKNQNPTTSKTGFHSIESSIVAESKISHLMRRLELLEAKKQSTVNKSTHPKCQIRIVFIAMR